MSLVLRVELERFFPYHVLEAFFGWLEVVPGPVEGLVALGLSFFVVESLEVWVLQTLFYSVALFWIKYQHLA